MKKLKEEWDDKLSRCAGPITTQHQDSHTEQERWGIFRGSNRQWLMPKCRSVKHMNEMSKSAFITLIQWWNVGKVKISKGSLVSFGFRDPTDSPNSLKQWHHLLPKTPSEVSPGELLRSLVDMTSANDGARSVYWLTCHHVGVSLTVDIGMNRLRWDTVLLCFPFIQIIELEEINRSEIIVGPQTWLVDVCPPCWHVWRFGNQTC